MCVFEHFENCDPLTKHEKFCLFHKPNKSEEEAALFYKRLEEKFITHEEDIEIKGKILKRKYFAGKMDFKGYVFPPPPKEFEVLFSNAIFAGDVNFERAIFEGSLDFWNSIFKGDVNFTKCIFRDNVSFLEAVFIGNADFSEAKFFGKADFWEATFEKNAIFWEAEFKNDAIFIDTVFKGDADFGLAHFNHGLFMNEEYCYLFTWEDAEFEEHRIVKYLHTYFNFDLFNSKLKREGNKIVVYDTFNSAEIAIKGSTGNITINYAGGLKKTKKLKVNASEGKNKLFVRKNPLFFSEISLFGVTFNMLNINLESDSFALPSAEIEMRRIQRLSCEKQGKLEELDSIFVKERRALRRAKLYEAVKKFKSATHTDEKIFALFRISKAVLASIMEILIADATCEYGTNWLRPVILWVFLVLFLFPFAYKEFGLLNAKNYVDYIYFSSITATTVGYGDFVPIGLGKVLAMIEAIFGLFIWAIFLAVFSRKYMIRTA